MQVRQMAEAQQMHCTWGCGGWADFELVRTKSWTRCGRHPPRPPLTGQWVGETADTEATPPQMLGEMSSRRTRVFPRKACRGYETACCKRSLPHPRIVRIFCNFLDCFSSL